MQIASTLKQSHAILSHKLGPGKDPPSTWKAMWAFIQGFYSAFHDIGNYFSTAGICQFPTLENYSGNIYQEINSQYWEIKVSFWELKFLISGYLVLFPDINN